MLLKLNVHMRITHVLTHKQTFTYTHTHTHAQIHNPANEWRCSIRQQCYNTNGNTTGAKLFWFRCVCVCVFISHKTKHTIEETRISASSYPVQHFHNPAIWRMLYSRSEGPMDTDDQSETLTLSDPAIIHAEMVPDIYSHVIFDSRYTFNIDIDAPITVSSLLAANVVSCVVLYSTIVFLLYNMCLRYKRIQINLIVQCYMKLFYLCSRTRRSHSNNYCQHTKDKCNFDLVLITQSRLNSTNNSQMKINTNVHRSTYPTPISCIAGPNRHQQLVL